MIKRFLLGALAVLLAATPAFATATATINLSGSVTGLRDGTLKVSAPAFSASSAIGQKQIVALTTATASITIPSGTTGVLLVMPASNTNTVDLTGGSLSPADSHINLSGTAYWAFLPLASGATLVASASAATNLSVTFF